MNPRTIQLDIDLSVHTPQSLEAYLKNLGLSEYRGAGKEPADPHWQADLSKVLAARKLRKVWVDSNNQIVGWSYE